MKILMLGPIVLAAVAFSVLPHAATAQAQTQMEGKPHRDMQKMHDEMHSRRGKAHHPGAEMKERLREQTKSCYDYAWESQDMKDCFARQQSGHGHPSGGTHKRS
jgi:hypothetical protein